MISWSKAVQTPFFVNCKSSSMIPEGRYLPLVFNPSATKNRDRQIGCIISFKRFVIEINDKSNVSK